jgi:hypothetical protein
MRVIAEVILFQLGIVVVIGTSHETSLAKCRIMDIPDPSGL